jgi:hypothetical protein
MARGGDVSEEYELPKVRIEIGESAILTRVFVDGRELRGIVRVWFDSGDIQGKDRPGHGWYKDTTRVHLEFMPQELVVEGVARTDFIETQPVYIPRVEKVPA